MYENLTTQVYLIRSTHSKSSKNTYPVLLLLRQWPQRQRLGRMDRPAHKSACLGPRMYSRDKSSGRPSICRRVTHIYRTSDSCSGQPRSLGCCVSSCSTESISLQRWNTSIYQRHVKENGITEQFFHKKNYTDNTDEAWTRSDSTESR